MWGGGGREGAGASRDAWQKVKCLHVWVVHVRESVLMVPLRMFVESVYTIQAFCRVCKIHVTAQRLCETSSHPDLRCGNVVVSWFWLGKIPLTARRCWNAAGVCGSSFVRIWVLWSSRGVP